VALAVSFKAFDRMARALKQPQVGCCWRALTLGRFAERLGKFYRNGLTSR
jgi:hypothetical protein